MTTSAFERVHNRVYRLAAPFEGGGTTHVYLVRGAKTLLIDSGVARTPTTLVAPALRALGLELSDVDLVANTHGHMDHLGGNAELKDVGSEIALHRDDLPRAQSNRFLVEHAAQTLRELGLEALIPAREARLLRLLGREVGVDRLLEDGDVLDLGGGVRLDVVHTPGHTPGSVCYRWEAAGLVFTGDAVQGRGSRPGGLPLLEDPMCYAASVDRVASLEARALLMAHSFRGVDGVLGPVAEGPRATQVLRDSLTVHQALTQATARAVAELPSGTASQLARRALAELEATFEFEPEATTGFPPAGVVTFPAYLRALRQSGSGAH